MTPQPGVENITGIRVLMPTGNEAVYMTALWLLVAVDMWCTRASFHRLLGHGPYAPIYLSTWEQNADDPVCYDESRLGQENWLSTEALYQRRWGVCEDLACARVAERLTVADPCAPFLLKQTQGPNTAYHVVVRNPDGKIEDPSALLGMYYGQENDKTTASCRRRIEEK